MILFIDCTKGMDLVLIKNKQILWEKKSNKLKNISEKLVLEIEKALYKLRLNYKNLKTIFIVTGPGSFTGVRSAITFAKIIKLTLNVKIYGITRFQILNLLTFSKSTPNNKDIYILNSKSSFFYQRFNKNSEGLEKSKIVDLGQKFLKNNNKSTIVSDTALIKKYVEFNKFSKEDDLIKIKKYKIDDIEKLSKNLKLFSCVIKPLYVKNFY